MKSGFLYIDKPENISTFDVIRRLRKITGIKKMGHAGTLDPFATGLVLIAIDNATRMLKFFDNATKSYLAGMHFGIKTDTGDLTGLTIQTDDNIPQFNLKTLEKHVKLINKQIPPKYSAKKINGKKAYELARQNKDFELKEKDITIHSFRVLTLKYPELYYDCRSE
ncbi:MAG: tRNA pseudouridine(55) synthase TruB, partial [Candidatus Cloacimonetes bacterium]|nr:tRNA pseudouridine(55) synthase TruB [Candidatus Cloacimonadota bacterium]